MLPTQVNVIRGKTQFKGFSFEFDAQTGTECLPLIFAFIHKLMSDIDCKSTIVKRTPSVAFSDQHQFVHYILLVFSSSSSFSLSSFVFCSLTFECIYSKAHAKFYWFRHKKLRFNIDNECFRELSPIQWTNTECTWNGVTFLCL